MMPFKPIRIEDEADLYFLHKQGWELHSDARGLYLRHTDGRETPRERLVRNAILEVILSHDPDVLSAERKQTIIDCLGQ